MSLTIPSIFISLVFSLGLAAQTPYYNGNILVTTVSGESVSTGGIGHFPISLVLTDSNKGERSVPPPSELGRQQGICERMEQWREVTYAVARLNHPVFERVGDFWNPKDHSSRSHYLPRAIYSMRNGKTWERLATFNCNPYRGMGTFVPLEDGRFIMNRWDPAFKLDGDSWPLGIYSINEMRQLVLDRPLEAWRHGMILRTPFGITLLNAPGGRSILLSNVDGHLLRDDNFENFNRRTDLTMHFRAAPRPDGQILLSVIESKPSKHRTSSYMGLYGYRKRHALTPVAELSVKRLMGEYLGRSDLGSAIDPPTISWWVLSPAQGTLHPISQPVNVPIPKTDSDLDRFGFTVAPDGNLEFTVPDMGIETPSIWELLTAPIRSIRASLQAGRKGGEK